MTEEQKKLVEELKEFLLKLDDEPIIIGTGREAQYNEVVDEANDELREIRQLIKVIGGSDWGEPLVY